MNILYDGDAASPVTQLCLVFGAGLIGSRIISRLQYSGMPGVEKYPFSWDSSALQRQQLQVIDARINGLLGSVHGGNGKVPRLSVVWSAGRGGFAASSESLAVETDAFRQVMEFARRLFMKYRPLQSSFHMLSSAGGLFEGQTNVGPAAKPSPIRPYGHAKLEQEGLLMDWQVDCGKFSYRPSSVYGCPHRHQRMGLIPTLLRNGMQQRVVGFSGGMDTVRDYVTSDDVSRFVSAKIQSGDTRGGVFTLASAEPITLQQLKVAAERCIRRKIYSCFELNPGNMANNSFLPSALPSGWRPQCVSTGLRLIYSELLKTGGSLSV